MKNHLTHDDQKKEALAWISGLDVGGKDRHSPAMEKPAIDLPYLSKLARLPLTEDEAAHFSDQLGDIMTHIEKLKEVDVSGIEPTAHAVDTVNRVRQDVAHEAPGQDALLPNAPDSGKDQLRVPKVVDA